MAQLPRPYFFTPERTIGFVERSQMAPREGPTADKVYGYHTVWIAEVPFIPTIKSDTYKDFDFAAGKRLDFALLRQKRFLSDLAQLREHQITFEMRLVSWAQHHSPAQVGIAFLGKVFHEDKQTSYGLAVELWDKFSALFPKEVPFSYPLVPVQRENDKTCQQTHNFSQWYQPLSFEQLVHPGCIVELRKYEDWPPPILRGAGGNIHPHDYLPHSFEPALDYSALARLYEALASQQETCIVSVVLRPQRLADQEMSILYSLLGWHQQAAHEGISSNTQHTGHMSNTNLEVRKVYLSTRAKLGTQVYERLIREQHCLFTMRLQVMGLPTAQQDVIEAFGSEVVANVSNDYPSLWSRVVPATQQELDCARFNAQWLEFVRWGTSPLIIQVPELTRFRQLATVDEAMGAFRLPIAPDGGLAGIEVRDEPFSLPAGVNKHKTGFTIGTLLDRGVRTQFPFTLPIEALLGFTLLLGDDGRSRKAMLRALLQGAGSEGIPWVLIRNVDPESADLMRGLSVRHVVLDAHTHTQLQGIQPFLPPPGVSLSIFLDALLQVFSATCQLESSSALLLRKALVETYKPYEVDRTCQMHPTDLALGLEKALQHMSAPDALINMLYVRALLPLQDLATTTETIFTASPPTVDSTWTLPTVIEIGLVGSAICRTLLRGCLWAWFSLALTPKERKQRIRGIVAVEDAYTIFGMLPKTSTLSISPTIALAQVVAQMGISTLLVDNRAHLLADEVTNGTEAIIVTNNSNQSAQEKAAQFIGASPRERERMCHLRKDEAVVLVSGTPLVLMTLPRDPPFTDG